MEDIVYTHRSRQSFLFKIPYIIFLERKKNVLGCYINVDERGLFSRQFLSHALSCDNTEINSEMWMNNVLYYVTSVGGKIGFFKISL